MMKRISLMLFFSLAMPLAGQPSREKTPTSPETEQALSIAELKAKAEKGNADAQFKLGVCYDHGDGVAKNLVEAVKWFREAAEQGDGLPPNLKTK